MNRFLRGAMILTICGIIVKIIGAGSKILISRLLGGEGIGLYQMAAPIYQVLASLATAGLPVAISILVAERLAVKDMRGVSRIFQVAMTGLIAMGLICGVGLYWLAPWLINSHLVIDERAYYAIVALAPSVMAVTVLSCLRGYFQGFQAMLPTGISQIFEQIVRVTAMIGFASALLPRGLDWAAAGTSFSTFPGIMTGIAVLLVFYYRQRHLRRTLRQEQDETIVPASLGHIIKRLLVLAVPVSMANIMLPIMSSIDFLVVPRRLLVAGFSVEEATTYFGYLTGMATSLINLPTLITASLAASLVPAISEAYALKKAEVVRERTDVAMRVTCLLSMPAFIGLCVLATPISQMLYATPHAGPSIAIMSLTVLLMGIQQVSTGILQGLGHTLIPMVGLAFSALVKLVLSWVLTAQPSLGINGAAWATNVNFAVAAGINLYFVTRYTRYTLPVWRLGAIALSSLAMGGATMVAYYFLTPWLSNTVSVLLCILLAFVVYAVALLVTRAVCLADMYQLPLVGKKLQARFGNFTPEDPCDR